MNSLDVWWDNERRRIATAAGVIALVEELAATLSNPAMVEVAVVEDAGKSFSLGLGADETIALFQESLDGPYFSSLGADQDRDEFVFESSGEPTFYPGFSVIPLDVGIAALRQFLCSHKLPECIAWEKL